MRAIMRRGLVLVGLALAACGGSSGPSLDDFLPPIPEPDGTAQSVFAGPIAQQNAAELIPGPAATGRVGDYFMRNSKARFVIESPARVIGLDPWGGNLVDATFTGAGAPGDSLGEVALVYYLGRTCAHEEVNVLLDGSGGGPAVIRATGRTAVNDFVNLIALGVFPLPEALNPDVPDGMTCATTYTLRPDADTMEIAFTLFNPGPGMVQGPFGLLNDTGGEIQVFSPGRGFDHLGQGFQSLLAGGSLNVPYATYQAPDIVYGLIPKTDNGAAGIVVAGASVLIYGANNFLDIVNRDKDALRLPAAMGVTFGLDFVVARQGNDVEAAWLRGKAATAVSGRVAFAPSGTGTRARVVVYKDANANELIDEATDPVVTTFDSAADGTYAGVLAPGNDYLFRADVPDVTRSSIHHIMVGATAVAVPELSLPEPARYDYTIVDADSGMPIPAKITVVGQTPLPLAKGTGQNYERVFGLVTLAFAPHGTSMAPGTDPSDPVLALPAGGPYRIVVSRGPEWTIATRDIQAAVAGSHVVLPDFQLRRVVDTTGYVATALHEHSIGSPDSPTGFEDRVRSLAVEGVEFFSSTDHDRLTDYGPVITALGLGDVISSVVGIEATPFAYGHFNAYPLDIDPTDASGGAVDWGLGPRGFSMLPKEIWDELRVRGAQVVQVCHPRSQGFGRFQGYFWRAGLEFDFIARSAAGVMDKQEFPNEALRLPPGETLYSDTFDVLEIWNDLNYGDTNGDGTPEFTIADTVLHDWMNFLSLGKMITPVGNGDTHNRERDPAGIPRTLVRVPDDTPEAIQLGIQDEVWKTLRGAGVPRDVVVTNGPFIMVAESGAPGSAIGRVVAVPPGEPAVLDVTVQSPSWIDFDTVEVFANSTFDELQTGESSALQPILCFTSRTGLDAEDPCAKAMGGARSLTVSVANGLRQADVSISLAAADVQTRPGKTGTDAWLVVRARGRRALYPMTAAGAITAQNLSTLVSGDDVAVAVALDGIGAPAMAFTAPVLLDYDGNGWRAPFAP